MDKEREQKLFEYVYGTREARRAIKQERPDFLCVRRNTVVLGCEITELFHNESDARLKKIKGYASDLLNGGRFRHKKDKKNIMVDRIRYIKKGESKGREINAIIRQMPNPEEKISDLVKTIKEKEHKVGMYLHSCPKVDLVIDDASSIFRFDSYEDFFLVLSQLINRRVVIQSQFREIFLVTTNEQSSVVRIPLKLNLFAEDVNIFEKLIKRSVEANKYDNPKKVFGILFCCIYKSGYQNVRVTIGNGSIGVLLGAFQYLYSKDGKTISEYITVPEQLTEGELIGDIVNKVCDAEKRISDRLIDMRPNYRCCMSLYSVVNKV